jgi:dihydroorotate dehydrogenase (fumarate)
MDLRARYMGLELAHPFILGASPLTGHLDNAKRLEDGGCAAIVMHSLFEEQVAHAEADVFMPSLPFDELSGSPALFPRPEVFPLGPDEYLGQLRRIRAAVAIPVIGSLNAAHGEAWLRYAPLIEQAGAHALELNMYSISTGLDDSATEIEREREAAVREVRARLRIPVAVKLSPFYTAFANMAARLERAGADGLVLFNRFYQPDLDVERLEILQNVRLSTSAELLLRLRWLAVLSGRLRVSLAITGGVHTALDGIKAVLSGAHAVQVVSAILQQGAGHFRTLQDGLRHWMSRNGHESVGAVRGRLDLSGCSDPAFFERSQYLRILQSWSA